MKNLKIPFILLLLLAVLSSCNRAKQAGKDAINKTGETVGKGTAEFFHGASNGVDETLQSTLVLSKPLSDKGLQAGKYRITYNNEAGSNVLSVYLIFNKYIKENIVVKVYDEKGQEYGRSTTAIEGKKGEAKYFDFPFDKRTQMESKSNFVFDIAD